MKKLYLLIIAFGLLPLFSFSQDYWEQLYFPDTADIKCIAINNSGDLFIGTGSNNTIGGLYRSTDGAQSWDMLFSNGDFSVRSVYINQEGTIYLTKGGLVNILTSTDNGDTWDTIDKPSYINNNLDNIVASGIDTLFISTTMTSTPILFRSYDNGITWDSVFTTYNGTSEQISDIIINPDSKVIYISLIGFFQNMGGVYKSEDGGDTWEFIGLYNYQLTSLALNSDGDLFAGSWYGLADTASEGTFVLRNNDTNWQVLTYGQVNDIIINSENEIYCGTTFGVIFSGDNGETFELINSGLPTYPYIDNMAIDSNGFIYLTGYLSSLLAKSVETTIDITENQLKPVAPWFEVYPNPCYDHLYLKNYNLSPDKLVEIKITNLITNESYKSSLSLYNEEYRIDVNRLVPGFYYIEISLLSGKKYAVKFIKR